MICYVKKKNTNRAAENFAVNFPNMSIWRYNFQIREESSNPRYFDRKQLKIGFD
jgi:hypothetical protein